MTKNVWEIADRVTGDVRPAQAGGTKPARGLRSRSAIHAGVVIDKEMPPSWKALASSLPNAPQSEQKKKKPDFLENCNIEDNSAHVTPDGLRDILRQDKLSYLKHKGVRSIVIEDDGIFQAEIVLASGQKRIGLPQTSVEEILGYSLAEILRSSPDLQFVYGSTRSSGMRNHATLHVEKQTFANITAPELSSIFALCNSLDTGQPLHDQSVPLRSFLMAAKQRQEAMAEIALDGIKLSLQRDGETSVVARAWHAHAWQKLPQSKNLPVPRIVTADDLTSRMHQIEDSAEGLCRYPYIYQLPLQGRHYVVPSGGVRRESTFTAGNIIITPELY